MPPADSEPDTLLALLTAAADPVRLRILALLREPLPVQEICTRLGLAQPRASHHLAVLRGCGLLTVRADGRRRFYAWSSTLAGPAAELQALLERWLPGPAGRTLRTLAPPPGASMPGSTAPSRPGDAEPRGVPQSLDDYLL